MKILVDVSEPKEIPFLLREKGLDVEVLRLSAGDYVVGNIGIERKKTEDYLATLYDETRDLWGQVFNLKESFPICYLALIGDIPTIAWKWKKQVPLSYKEWMKKRNTILNTSCRMEVKGIPVKYFYDDEDFIEWLEFLFYQSGEKESLRPVPRKRHSVPDIKLDIVTRLPGVGAKGGKILLDKYGTIQNLSNTSVEDLVKIPNLGSKTGKKIIEVLQT